nr:13320_t:CDS:2 [Entrophospora candida]
MFVLSGLEVIDDQMENYGIYPILGKLLEKNQRIGECQYYEWKNNNDEIGWDYKYYKDLASHTPNGTKEYFKNYRKYLKKFKQMDNEDQRVLEIVFAKSNTDECKKWIKNIEQDTDVNYYRAIIMVTNNRKHPANDNVDEENINSNNAEQKQ